MAPPLDPPLCLQTRDYVADQIWGFKIPAHWDASEENKSAARFH